MLTVPELWQVVADKLKRENIATQIPPGTRLVESSLARRFGTSRGPISEALRELERQGMVVSVSRRGTVVCSLSAKDAAEIYAVREALELLPIRELAAERREGTFEALPRHLSAMDGPAEGRAWVEVIQHDVAFHRTIVVGADNARLLGLWEDLAAQVAMLIGVGMAADSDTAHKGVGGHHETILNALEDSDRDLAGHVLSTSCQQSVGALRNHLRPT